MFENHLQIRPSPKLMESMRALGYTSDVAVADIVDNSLDAGASSIEIRGDVSDEPAWLWVSDNGQGMTLTQMVEALKLAAVSSVDARGENDLGRFGLGLKTASFSQCRRLTVISRRDGVTHGIRFDLDELRESDDWSVRRLEESDLGEVPGFQEFSKQEFGTLVCWQKLDRLMESRSSGAAGMGEVIAELRAHLGLTFHRLLAPEDHIRGGLSMVLNGRAVQPIDPFLRQNRAVEMTSPEAIKIGNDTIKVQAFTLPDSSLITGPDAERKDLRDGMYAAQGFYFYRNRRLISHGGWANLGGRRDSTKHSRILVDLPNSTDDQWQLDVMKNKVVPPASVRRQLARFYEVGSRKSGRIISYRGRRVSSPDVEYAWIPVTERGGFRYEPNIEHPVLDDALTDLSQTQRDKMVRALRHLGLLIPYGDIRRRMSIDDEVPAREHQDALVQHVLDVVATLELDLLSPETVGAVLQHIEPFAGRRDLEQIIARAAQAHR
ncbi:ATP-binding protein [Nesterenkonia jeotgali]|uniref:ATP-binding protein n=1 Tax=Nesterenkonia jeotgali TaxID=317018 RepID=A0A0W8IFJ7_9MICC|nr:ATP-binding protein [Nesterenkonia jeotgali]KUG58724.1 hypothetical protein AVL63_01285 [Nesterenkonia jeotgali]